MKTFVSRKAGATQYTAESLEDLAQFCDSMEKNSNQIAGGQVILQREKRYHQGQAAAYKHVANVLRNCLLVHGLPELKQGVPYRVTRIHDEVVWEEMPNDVL
jgi:uncharacterized FAD-dependent dehydrogenase